MKPPPPQIRPTCYLVTVGTSLVKNKGRWSDDPYDDAVIAAPDFPPAGLLAAFDDRIREQCEALETQARSDEIALRTRSAELAALYIRDLPGTGTPPPPPFHHADDRVYLIGTRSEKGLYCTELLTRILTARAQAHRRDKALVQAIFPPYLSLADHPEFSRRGIPSFLRDCVKILEREREHCDRVLAPNGGYKTLIAYLSLLGLLEDIPIRYVHEDSDRVHEFPPLPLGIDILRWRRARQLFSIIEGQPYDENSDFFQKQGFKGLIEPRDTGLGQKIFALGAVGRYFDSRFLAVSGHSELDQLASNISLLGNLENPNTIDIRGMFVRLSRIMDYLWTADRLTEMVDHGLLHHFDLFAIAERVLVPLFWWWEETHHDRFLTQWELFTLLGAVALHDIGHVVGSLDGERLFSTQVRDHHHMLAYLRLAAGPAIEARSTADELLARPIYEWLLRESHGNKEIGSAWILPGGAPRWSTLWHDFLKAIATLGVYHRRRSPLTELPAQPYKFLKAIDGLTDPAGVLLPLIQLQPLHCGPVDLDSQRVKLLVALLRMIDCLDQQCSRTGPERGVQLHLASLDRDRVQLEGELAEICALAVGDLGRELASWRSMTFEAWHPASLALREDLRQADRRRDEWLVREYVYRLDTLGFKTGQDDHFKYKLRVREVEIQTTRSANGFCVSSGLKFFEEVTKDQCLDAETVILADIEKELSPVREILERFGIEFQTHRQV